MAHDHMCLSEPAGFLLIFDSIVPRRWGNSLGKPPHRLRLVLVVAPVPPLVVWQVT